MKTALKQACLLGLATGASTFGLSVGAAAQTAPAAAQTAPADQSATDTSSSQEIIVTASRRAQLLQDVPMSVNVVSGQDLRKLNLFDAKDITKLAPGLELTNTSGRNNTTTLRGITFDPDQGTAPAVQVYLNEIPTDAQTVYTALYDIGQIEVLRGPQGLLRGLSAPAGAITISTKRPGFDAIEGYVQATGTSRSAYNFQGGITLPFSDTFSIRAAVLADGNQGNQVFNIKRNQLSRSRTESGRLTLGWKPSSNFSAFVTYQYLEADNIQNQQVFGPGNAPSLAAAGDPTRSGPAIAVADYKAVSEGIFRFRNRTSIINLSTDWDFGPATLSFVGAHQDSRLISDRDQDDANSVPNYIRNQNTNSPYLYDTGELRLTTNGEGMFGGGVGVFYQSATGTTVASGPQDSFFGAFPVAFGVFLPINTNVVVPVNSKTVSFNGNAHVKIGKLTLEGGLRYSLITNRQIATINVTSPGNAAFGVAAFNLVQDGIPLALQRTRETPLTGGATLTYQPNRDLTLYASYGRAFRSGSSGVAAPVGISNDLIQTKPEKTDSFEVGVKAALLDRRLNVSVDGFYQKIDNYLARFFGVFYNCPDFFGSCNSFGPPINNATQSPDGSFDFNYNGNATIKGIEASVEGRPFDSWDVSVSASYIRARYDNARLPCNDFNGDGKPDSTGLAKITGTGNVSFCNTSGRLADVPDFSLTANSELRFPVGNITPFVRGLVSYRPSVFSDKANFNYDTRTIADVYIGLHGPGGRWEINAFAKNVLNQKKITNISLGEGQLGPYLSGYRQISATAPREFGLTTSYKF